MTERPFNPEQPATKIHGSDGSRFIQDGHFYGGPPHFRLICAPVIGHLAGVQEQDGTLRSLAELSRDELLPLAQGMEIAGAAGMTQADLAQAIGAEPVEPLSDQAVAPLAALPEQAPGEAVQHTLEQLDDMKVAELRELAKTLGVSGRNKDDLIAEILAAQAKAAAE